MKTKVAPRREDESVAFGSYRLFPSLRLLLKDGVKMGIGNRAFDVLMHLVEAAGETVSKETLLLQVWSDGVVEENNLQAQIAALRKMFGTDKDLITTEFARGYRFTGTVHRQAESPFTNPVIFPIDCPRPRSPLVGRTEELGVLQPLLTTQRLCTLTGPAGIGKTRLALEAAWQARMYFPNGVYFVDLSQLTKRDTVYATIMGALAGMMSSGLGVPHPQRALLVLDHCEHLLSHTVAALEKLLNADALLCVMATSQIPLAMEGEQVLRLRPLDTPPINVPLVQARQYSAVELFVRRVASADYHFRLSDENVAMVATLCKALEGVPLALEIAAARVPSLGLATVVQDLTNKNGLLLATGHRIAGRYDSIGDALDWSYQLLAPMEQRVFQALAIFPGDFTLAAAETVWAQIDDEPSRLLDVLSSLVDKSFISIKTYTPPCRYRYLAMLRAYARQQGEQYATTFAMAHAQFVEKMVKQADVDWEILPTSQWQKIYEHHIDDVKAALNWSFDEGGLSETGLNILAGSTSFWIQQSLWDECRQRVIEVIRAAEQYPMSQRQEMMIQAMLGTSLIWSVGPLPTIREAWQRVGELARELNDHDMCLKAEYGLWLYCLRRGHYRLSLSHGQQMAHSAQEKGDQVALLIARRLIGTSHHFLGHHGRALEEMESMLEGYHRAGELGANFKYGLDQEVIGWAYLARIAWVAGDTEKARRAAQIAVDAARELGHATTLCGALLEGFCTISALAGNWDDVAEGSQQATQIATQHGLHFWGVYSAAFNLWIRSQRAPESVTANELKAALDTLSNNGFDTAYSVFLADFSQALIHREQPTWAVTLIDDRLAAKSVAESLWNEPELLRVKALALSYISPKSEIEQRTISQLRQQATTLAHAQQASCWLARLEAERCRE